MAHLEEAEGGIISGDDQHLKVRRTRWDGRNPKMTAEEEEIIDVDAGNGRRRSARKRTEKEVFDSSGGETISGSTPNENQRLGLGIHLPFRKLQALLCKPSLFRLRYASRSKTETMNYFSCTLFLRTSLPIYDHRISKIKLFLNLLLSVNIGPILLFTKCLVRGHQFVRSPVWSLIQLLFRFSIHLKKLPAGRKTVDHNSVWSIPL